MRERYYALMMLDEAKTSRPWPRPTTKLWPRGQSGWPPRGLNVITVYHRLRGFITQHCYIGKTSDSSGKIGTLTSCKI